ncbi:hypothetical protein Tco_0879661 [Tanacetum coccineum]
MMDCRCHQDCFAQGLKSIPLHPLHPVVSEQDELPSSVGLDFRARLDAVDVTLYLEAKPLPCTRLMRNPVGPFQLSFESCYDVEMKRDLFERGE